MVNVDPICLNDAQAVPRAVWYDTETKNNLIQLPVEEINGLRGHQVTHKGIHLGAGEVIEVPGATGSQVTFGCENIISFSIDIPIPETINLNHQQFLSQEVYMLTYL